MVEDPQCSSREILVNINNNLIEYRNEVSSMMKYSANMIPPKLMLIIVGIVVLAFTGAEGLKLLTIWSTKILGGA